MQLNKSQIGYIIVLGSILGFPLVATISTLTNQSTNILSIVLRAIILTLCLFAFININSKNRIIKILIYTFWILYLIRLFYDTQVLEIKSPPYESSYIIMNAIGVTFIPTVAILNLAHLLDANILLKKMYRLTQLLGLLIIIIVIMSEKSIIEIVSSDRFSVNTDFEKSSKINPILISLIGTLLIVLSFFFYNINESKSKLIDMLSSILFGFFFNILGSSRSPLLGLLCCIFILSFKKFNLKIVLLLIILTLFTYQILSYLNIIDDVLFIGRIASTSIENEDDTRLLMFKGAFSQFLENPILGSSFVEKKTQTYPHNIFVESLMSIGIIGILPFLLAIFTILKFSFSKINNAHLYIYLLFIIYTILFSFSFPLYQSAEFWIFLVLLNFGQFKVVLQRKSI